MKFWPTFFGSLGNPNTYVDARLIHRGFGVRYSILLVALMAVAALTYLLSTTTFTQPTLRDLESIGVIFAITLVMRACMLLPLTIVARLVGYGMKMQLTNGQAARITAIAYTPVSICDTVAFCVAGYAITPPILFACGVLMLLAAVHASK